MLSVATPVYNRARTAVKALESIINDEYVDNLIVVDDGSRSDQFEILKDFCGRHKKIQLIRNKENLGPNGNYRKILEILADQENEFLFLCESDMLLAPGWGKYFLEAFRHSKETVCLAPMLHVDQLRSNRSYQFQQRCLNGVYQKKTNGSLEKIKTSFGSCYTEFPDREIPLKIGRLKLRYVSNSVCTMVFRRVFLKKIPLENLSRYPCEEDAWLSWSCFAYNGYHPQSLAAFDPGLAFTFGEEGLHGPMMLCNKRWAGSFWWRYSATAVLMKLFFRLKISFLKRLQKLLP